MNKSKIVPITETRDYKERREQIQAEINSGKISIDRSVFAKSEEEKAALKEAKKLEKQWRMKHAS